MTSAHETPPKVSISSLFSLRTLHLFTLCGFAFTQPLLVALAGRSVYFHDEHIGLLEIGALLVVLMIVLPIVFLSFDQLMLRLSQRFGGRGRNTVIAVLFGMICLSLMRPYLSIRDYQLVGGGFAALALVVPCAWFAVRLYERTTWFQSWLTFASVGLLAFPAYFLWQFHLIQQAEKVIELGTAVENRVPVIMVVFDEFSGISLLNEQMNVDSNRFPNFARLANCSTWYRNATTVHPRTDVAVPAILSGRFPVTDLPPVAAQYPGNLLQIIEATNKFDMAVFEPVSRLCPRTVRKIPQPERTAIQKSFDLIYTLATVYPRLILTSDTPIWLPTIPRPWFGLPNLGAKGYQVLTDLDEGLFNYPGDENRPRQFQQFLRCVTDSEKPRFCFFHTVLPHYPWCFLPNGEQYQSEQSAPHHPAGAAGELGEDWLSDPAIILRNQYRYRLQLGFVDRLIGQLLDRLEETAILDRCLLIVTADHGVSFQPGHSRRLPDADNLPDILSVPLFIKLPGQSQARIDDRNVESVDLLPTIAEVLGIQLQEPVDGSPVSMDQRRPRKSFYFDAAMTVVEPDLPQKISAAQKQFAAFGSDDLEHPPIATSSHPDWHGRQVASFSVDEGTIPFALGNALMVRHIEAGIDTSAFVNRFVKGWLEARDLRDTPADLVVVVDGIIVDTGRSFPLSTSVQGFEFLLPRSVTIKDPMQVEIYLVDSTTPDVRLKQLKNQPDRASAYIGL